MSCGPPPPICHSIPAQTPRVLQQHNPKFQGIICCAPMETGASLCVRNRGTVFSRWGVGPHCVMALRMNSGCRWQCHHARHALKACLCVVAPMHVSRWLGVGLRWRGSLPVIQHSSLASALCHQGVTSHAVPTWCTGEGYKWTHAALFMLLESLGALHLMQLLNR